MMKFHEHIMALTGKGHKMAGWALRVFKSRGLVLMRTLLRSIVVPQMEYACVIWSPTDQRHIQLLENVQRRFTSRFACFQEYDHALGMPICTYEYHSRLSILKIYSLERRRERYMILYVFKILIELVPNPGLDLGRERYNDRTGLRITPKFCCTAPRWVQKARESSFFFQGPSLFNALPRDFRQIEDSLPPVPNQEDANINDIIFQLQKQQVARFKSKLDKFLDNIPDIPGTIHNALLARLR